MSDGWTRWDVRSPVSTFSPSRLVDLTGSPILSEAIGPSICIPAERRPSEGDSEMNTSNVAV